MSPKTPKTNSATRRARPTIYTVGYEGYTLDEFLDLLMQHRISGLVDVRNRPSSHKPGFSKTPLSTALMKQEIEYIHLPQLGIPKEIRGRYRDENDIAILKRYLKAPLEQNHNLLLDILISFRDRNVCLMCFEKEPSLCHRTIIADFLAKHDKFKIHHI